MTIIPASWQRLIDEAREHDPHAIIAGGAIRDLICGRKPKDIDLFTLHGTAPAGLLGPSVHISGYNNDSCGPYTIEGIYQIRKKDVEYPIQLIKLDHAIDPLELIESFDFGICMAAYDGKEIIRSRHFDEDAEKHIFTLRHCRDKAAAEKRYQRISKRYIDYPSGPFGSWFHSGIRWPMMLSGKARLDLMLQAFEAKGKLSPNSTWRYY